MGLEDMGSGDMGTRGHLGMETWGLGTSGLRDIGSGGHQAWGHQAWRHGVWGTSELTDMGSGDIRTWGHGVWGLWGLGTGVLRAVPRCPHSACFREYFVHKFRAMLGKNRVIFPGEKVRGGGGTREGHNGGPPQAGDCPFCPRRCCWRCREGRHLSLIHI